MRCVLRCMGGDGCSGVVGLIATVATVVAVVAPVPFRLWLASEIKV